MSELCQHGVFPELCKACKVLRLQARVADLEDALAVAQAEVAVERGRVADLTKLTVGLAAIVKDLKSRLAALEDDLRQALAEREEVERRRLREYEPAREVERRRVDAEGRIAELEPVLQHIQWTLVDAGLPSGLEDVAASVERLAGSVTATVRSVERPPFVFVDDDDSEVEVEP